MTHANAGVAPSRLAPIEPENLSPAQQALVAAVEQGPRAQKHGRIGMAGPFGVWLRAPELGDAAQRFGAAVRFATSLPDNIKEISICAVGAHYRAKFEFYAHAPLALAAGVDPAVVEAIRTGERPALSNPSERAAYELTQALLDRHGWTDEEYAAGREVFTEQQLVELVTVVGYYCQISLTLNAFRVALPPGSADPFPSPQADL